MTLGGVISVVAGVAGAAGGLGRGLAEYSSEEAASIAGRKSDEIEPVLGYRSRAVMIHRDELVLFGDDS